jgi:hypothetical protein
MALGAPHLVAVVLSLALCACIIPLCWLVRRPSGGAAVASE